MLRCNTRIFALEQITVERSPQKDNWRQSQNDERSSACLSSG
jgi:hypothetical protein